MPSDFESHHRLSAACFFLGDKDTALRECRKALEITPDNPAARRNLETFLQNRE